MRKKAQGYAVIEQFFPYENHTRYWLINVSPRDSRNECIDSYIVIVSPETGEVLDVAVGGKG